MNKSVNGERGREDSNEKTLERTKTNGQKGGTK